MEKSKKKKKASMASFALAQVPRVISVVASSERVTGRRTKTTRGDKDVPPPVLKPARLGVVPRSGPVAASETEADFVDADDPTMDADATIEPCLVGWSERDEDGVEVYCCEQPGGGMECRTVGGAHDECVLKEDEITGEMTVSCDEKDVKAAKRETDEEGETKAA